MEKFELLNENELENIDGGKITHYPNGVYCNSETGTCSVDWEEAKASIGKIIVNGWIQYGPLAHSFN